MPELVKSSDLLLYIIICLLFWFPLCRAPPTGSNTSLETLAKEATAELYVSFIFTRFMKLLLY